MAVFDLRVAINAVSDVIVNRPPPLREFDQIYMKAGDMLRQAQVLSSWLDGKTAVFVGDGDALALCTVHLANLRILPTGPSAVHVLDFDERIVNANRLFAAKFDIDNILSAELYNVVDPLPDDAIARFDSFYTNPPFGASNGGRSVEAFVTRGIEACRARATACIVIADSPDLPWIVEVRNSVQRYLASKSFYVSELIPQFHQYHLDDTPELTSCCLRADREPAGGLATEESTVSSGPLPPEYREHFYGSENPLRVRYVRDSRRGGRLPSRDHTLERFEGE